MDKRGLLAHSQFALARFARRGGRWMRNPDGKRFSRGRPVSIRKERRDRRAAEIPRLKPACAKEKQPPWSPKESASPPGPGLRTKLGVGLRRPFLDFTSSILYNPAIGEPSSPKVLILQFITLTVPDSQEVVRFASLSRSPFWERDGVGFAILSSAGT